MPATDPIEHGEYQAIVAELRATTPAAPEALRQRVLALAPTPRSRRRKLVLVLVPTAAALAVGAALVHGFVSSGSSPTAKREVNLSAIAAPPHKTVHGSSALKQKAVPGAAYAADTQLQALNIPRNRLVHADATLGVQVADRAALSRATSKATQIVARLGGYAQSVRYATAHGGGGSAYLALRVPVGHVQTAVARLETLGTLLSQQLATEDLQHQVTQEAGRITTLRATIASYEKALESPSLGAAQRVILQVHLGNVRKTLIRVRQARSGALASAATANVSLTLSTKHGAGAAASHHRGRLGRMLGSAAGFLGLEGMIVLYALVVLSPFIVLGTLGWWLVRERRRRDERRLLASA